MIIEIDKDGMLGIKAETQLECYALSKWLEDNKELPKNMIVYSGVHKKKE